MTLLNEKKYKFVNSFIPKRVVGSTTHSLWLRNDNIVAS